jgi:ADP-ribose pyrophosphatase
MVTATDSSTHERAMDHTPPLPSPTDTPAPWPRHGSRRGPRLALFDVRFDDLTNPRTGERFERLVLETPDWVNVVAIDTQGLIVFVRQFRFGTSTVTLEIPGGMVDRGEDHGDAARRELVEETGYLARRWIHLGSIDPNPAIHDNAIHHWLALDAEQVGPPEPDAGEDLRVELLDPESVRTAVRQGAIRHSLVLCALAHVLDLRTHALDGRAAASDRTETERGPAPG